MKKKFKSGFSFTNRIIIECKDPTLLFQYTSVNNFLREELKYRLAQHFGPLRIFSCNFKNIECYITNHSTISISGDPVNLIYLAY